jgi:hypothetical protein
MEDDHRIKPVLDKLSQTHGAEAARKPKAEKGRAHEFPSHEHDAVAIPMGIRMSSTIASPASETSGPT